MTFSSIYEGGALYRHYVPCPAFNPPLSYWYRSYGLTLDSVPNAKIVVFGFPKTGNTWAQALLTDALNSNPLDPFADFDQSGIGVSHLPVCELITQRADIIHGVCMVRDPRDVVLSFYKYSQTPFFRKARPEFHYDDFFSFYFDWFLGRAASSLQFLTHAQKFAEQGVPIVRYECLVADTVAELRRLLLRWGLEISEETIEAAVNNNTLSKLQREGKKLSFDVPTSHFRSGKIGGFRSDMPGDIQKDINRRFETTILRWGYAPE